MLGSYNHPDVAQLARTAPLRDKETEPESEDDAETFMRLTEKWTEKTPTPVTGPSPPDSLFGSDDDEVESPSPGLFKSEYTGHAMPPSQNEELMK